MSSATRTGLNLPPRLESVEGRPFRTVALTIVKSVRALAFWVAVLLPIIVLIALVSGQAISYPMYFAGLLGLNVLCVFLGHNHSPYR